MFKKIAVTLIATLATTDVAQAETKIKFLPLTKIDTDSQTYLKGLTDSYPYIKVDPKKNEPMQFFFSIF
ncbi:hypothetical protein RI570_20185 [Brucella pseudogrignonensis]|uniref:hypothetical protein n=1 Tax=Brucella pseudogrignonensis TaxID=419475 RepID=UPI0028BCCD45|nr:hypothetical protein [Brucella pseudogrignonensis]MDT6942384.1 hypothetical protein [Brucella pseudogrignonensis]